NPPASPGDLQKVFQPGFRWIARPATTVGPPASFDATEPATNRTFAPCASTHGVASGLATASTLSAMEPARMAAVIRIRPLSTTLVPLPRGDLCLCSQG